LLELADEEFASLRDQTTNVEKVIKAQLKAGEEEIPLNLVSLEEYLANAPEMRLLIDHARSVGFNMEEDSEPTARSLNSDSLDFFRQHDITTVGQLRRLIHEASPWAAQFLSEVQKRRWAWKAPPGFIALLIIVATYKDRLSADELVAQQWNREIADDVLEAARATTSR
jgi:hypothetical protein